MNTRAIFLVIFFLKYVVVFAQHELRFESLKSSNKLSQHSVTSMLKDQMGFLWIGTYNGLNKFDGYKFTTYNLFERSQNKSFSSNYIKTIRQDKLGYLWIYTLEDKIHRFDPKTENLISFPEIIESSQSISCKMVEFSDSTQWVLTNKIGIYYVKPDLNSSIPLIKHIVNTPAQQSLNSNNVYFLVKDTDGVYWAGTDRGLNKIIIRAFDKSFFQIIKFDSIPGIINSRNLVFRDAVNIDHHIWFISKANGIILYDSQHKKFGLPRNNDLNKKLFKTTVTIMHNFKEDLWLGTLNGKLLRYNILNDSLTEYDFSNLGNLRKIYFDHSNQIWVSADKSGIICLDKKSGIKKQYNITPINKKSFIYGNDFFWFEDSRNNLWVGTQISGISLYNRKDDRFLTFMNNPYDQWSISSNTISCMLEDDEGELWLGLGGLGNGINRIIQIEPAFHYIKPADKPANSDENSVRSIKEDSNHRLWVATKGVKIYIYNEKNELITIIQNANNNNAPINNTYALYEDRKGYMWLCTKGLGLYRTEFSLYDVNVNYRNLHFINYSSHPNDPHSLSENKVYDIVEDDFNNYWIATFGGGLDRMTIGNNGKYIISHFSVENSNIPSNFVRCVTSDSKSRIWIGTTKGLSYIKPGETKIVFNNLLTNPTDDSGISYNDITKVIEDEKGTLWVSTNGGGINKLIALYPKSAVFKHYTTKNGLVDNLALTLINDKKGFIWISTDQGISKLNPANDQIENFAEENGLYSINFSENASTLTRQGKVIIGSLDGFYIIDPFLLKTRNSVPKLRLTGFRLFNKEVIPGKTDSPLQLSITYSDHVVLKYNQSSFSIEFTALSFTSNENNQYAYMLDGFDKTWNYTRTHEAVYTNIPHGKYIFRVKGSNGNVRWDEKGTSLNITILRPFWKTYTAYLLYAVLISVLSLIIFKTLVRIIRLENNLIIERKVAESKLRFFTNISHEFRTPLTLIIGPLDSLISSKKVSTGIKNQLKLADRNVKRLLRLINQLLDFRKIQNEKVKLVLHKIEFISFLKQIFDCYEAAARQKNIDFQFIHDVPQIQILGDTQMLDIVFFNLLSNAFKFTPENKKISMEINIGKDDTNVEVIISDEGIGIESENLPQIFDRFFVSHTDAENEYAGTGIGLSMVLEYIQLHHGNIEVKSKPLEGTMFIVTLPLNANYTADELLNAEIEEVKKNEPVEVQSEIYKNETVLQHGSDLDEKPLVLVVEDDIDMGKYISDILSDEYSIVLAKDGVEGWKKAQKLLPDIVITDAMMPRMNGFELVKKIKDDYKTCHLPVIMLTAKSMIEDQIEGIESGAEWYISKPFNPAVLHSYVKNIILQREKIREKFNNVIELKPNEIKVASKDMVFLNKAIKFIIDNMADSNFNVEKMSGMFEMSRTVFYKKMKAITGHQPVEFIRLLRLKRAAQLLQTNVNNVTEVAYQTGFNDVRYFSVCFKKQFGVTPSHFIENNRNDQGIIHQKD